MDILEEARKLRRYIENMSVNLDDETALDNVDVFPKWGVGNNYEVGYRVRYNEILYKVLQAHTSQADWTPDVAVSLFVRVAEPQEWPEWVQPTAENPYMIGSKVTFEGRHYISLIDNNVWSPTAYPAGWEEVPIGEENVEANNE